MTTTPGAHGMKIPDVAVEATMEDVRADVATLLTALEPHNTLEPPTGYWIENSDGEMMYNRYGGSEWCWEHGKEAAERMNLYTPGTLICEVIPLDSGGNYDTIPRCAECGITLAGRPTDHCRFEELCYFEDNPESSTDPEDIHIICMVLWNLQWARTRDPAEAWIAVGKTALSRLLPAAPASEKERADG